MGIGGGHVVQITQDLKLPGYVLKSASIVRLLD